MCDCMPKEQADWIRDTQLYCLNATNMTEDEAYNFAFRCWQLGFEKKTHTIRETKADTVRKMQRSFISACIKGGIYPAFVARTIENVAEEMLQEGK